MDCGVEEIAWIQQTTDNNCDGEEQCGRGAEWGGAVWGAVYMWGV